MCHVFNCPRLLNHQTAESNSRFILRGFYLSFSTLSLQFVVVSLKDGMFTNANVLFKTKFVDGMSTVTRTALSQSDGNLPHKGQDKARQKDKRNKQLIS